MLDLVCTGNYKPRTCKVLRSFSMNSWALEHCFLQAYEIQLLLFIVWGLWMMIVLAFRL